MFTEVYQRGFILAMIYSLAAADVLTDTAADVLTDNGQASP